MENYVLTFHIYILLLVLLSIAIQALVETQLLIDYITTTIDNLIVIKQMFFFGCFR